MDKEHECQHADSAGYQACEHDASRAKYKLNIEFLDARHNVLSRSRSTLVVTEQDAKLVLNKHMGLRSIVKSENQCTIKVQTEMEEYDSCGKLCVVPIFAQMYLKNGVLYLKR